VEKLCSSCGLRLPAVPVIARAGAASLSLGGMDLLIADLAEDFLFEGDDTRLQLGVLHAALDLAGGFGGHGKLPWWWDTADIA